MAELLRPERNQDSDLTSESLRAGKVDQYAIMRGGKRYVVELGGYAQPATPRRFYVKFEISLRGVIIESHLETFVFVEDARRRFNDRVRTATK